MGDSGAEPKSPLITSTGKIIPKGSKTQTRKKNNSAILPAPSETTGTSSAAAPVTVLPNLVQEMREGEEAVEAVRNLEEGERLAALPTPTPTLESTPKIEVAAIPTLKKPALKFTVIVKDTLTNGDCFYSSIFRAAQEYIITRDSGEQSLLTIIHECHPIIIISDETSFISSFRNLVADEIIADRLPSIKEKNGNVNVYDTLATGSAEETSNSTVYKQILEGFPEWAATDFETQLGTREFFLNFYAAGARKMENWVGEIDVRIVEQLLEPCKIKLNILNHVVTKLSKREGEYKIINLINYGESHYKYFSFNVPTGVPVPKTEIPIYSVETPLESASIPIGAVKEVGNDCAELFDPCTREPIENGDITILERRVRDIKKQRLLDITGKTKFPDMIINRLELLLFILNRNEKPNEDLLQYNNNGQLYESYWDIVFALGLIDTFPITKDFYMYNGKVETLINIDEEGFVNSPLTYLKSRNVMAGSTTGASDITFVYKKSKAQLDIDLCSSDPSLKVTDSCRKDLHVLKDEGGDRPKFFFCSSKYFNSDASKGVDKFDIQNIYTAAKNLHQDYDRKIILLVKDKGAVKEKLRKAIRKYISEESSYEYGMDDLFAALTSLYDFVHSKHPSNTEIKEEHIIKILKLESPPKPILRLRLHQYLATYKICDAIVRFRTVKGNNKFLVGIVPRGGKTFIAGGIIDRLNPKRVVVLLGAKSETLSQFKKDLFEEFQNFQDYTCIDVVKELSGFAIDPSKKYIFIMSVELYKTPESARTLIQELKGGVNRADLFICDEAHLKQTTAKAVIEMGKGTSAIKEEEEENITEEQEDKELQEIKKDLPSDIPIVYMTGTYIKPLKAFNIPDENVIIWDYQDIQQAKTLSTNENYFRENFGELYDRALQTCVSYGQTYESIEEQYKKFPELYLLTTQFTPDAKSAFLKQTTGGFPTISHLFEVKADFNPGTVPPENWYAQFRNPKGIIRLLNYLAPPSQQLGTIDSEAVEPISSVLKSVDNIAQRIGDRLGFFTSDFVVHSQLWFLPHMQRPHSLYRRMCALAGAIFQNAWFRKYFHIIAVSSSVKWNIPGSEQNSILIKARDGTDSCGTFSWACPTGDKSLKQCLIDQEALARQKGKGLIILAQNMLHLGISLPCVDIVVLLDVGEKVDERIQKMYRALTESTNKKGGYIVDMNYFRTVKAIMSYQITNERMRKGKKIYADDIKPLFNKVLDIFSIDDDKHILRDKIETETLPELQKLLETGKKTGDSIVLEEAGAALNANIKTVLEKGYMKSYDEFLGQLKEEEEKQRILREEGKNVKEAETDDENEDEGGTTTKPSYSEPVIFPTELKREELKRAAYIDIFKTTLKLGAFGTNSADIKTLENRLEIDEELRDILYDTLIKRGAIQEDITRSNLQKDFIIDVLIRPGLLKMIAEIKNTSYSKMKESVEDEEKYPAQVEKVLTYIKQHLAPKEAERHKFGEVFTPMTLVNDMLDTLPAGVWQEKDYKWLDPANGMGNYPIAVFLRLFYGFRTNKDGKYIGITEEGEGAYNPGLTKVIHREDARQKHIVRDMLYMVELNSKNNAIAKNLFKKLAPGVEPNIIQMHRKDGFLADVDMKFPNGSVNTFDIVMGNPPFNKGTILRKQTRKIKADIKEMGLEGTKRESLWTQFVLKIFSKNVLKKNGYLLFITPINWFHPEVSGVRDIFLSKQIDFIRIIFLEQSKKMFGGSGELTTAHYLIQNKEQTKSTIIIDMLNNKDTVRLNKDSIIILAYNSIYDKVCKKSTLFMNTNSIKSTTVTKCELGPNKQIIGIYESGDIKFVKTSEKHPLTNTPKIIINGYTYPRYYYDKAGEYGKFSKDGTNFIIIGKDLDKVESYFDTKLSALLLNYIKFTQKKIDPKYYPDVRTLPLDKITDETLADYFGFTKEERVAINTTEYPKRKYEFKEIKCTELKKEKETTEGGSRKSIGKTRKLKRT